MTTAWNRLKFASATDFEALLARKEQKNPLALLNRYVKEAENRQNIPANDLSGKHS